MENSIKFLKILFNITFQEGEYETVENKSEIFSIPKYIIKANLSYVRQKFFFGISGIWRSFIKPLEKHIDYKGKDLESSFLFNFNLGYKFSYYLPMKINLKIENMFNSSFNQPTSLAMIPYSLPFRGKSVILNYTIKF